MTSVVKRVTVRAECKEISLVIAASRLHRLKVVYLKRDYSSANRIAAAVPCFELADRFV
jgi:hypothetical protein